MKHFKNIIKFVAGFVFGIIAIDFIRWNKTRFIDEVEYIEGDDVWNNLS